MTQAIRTSTEPNFIPSKQTSSKKLVHWASWCKSSDLENNLYAPAPPSTTATKMTPEWTYTASTTSQQKAVNSPQTPKKLSATTTSPSTKKLEEDATTKAILSARLIKRCSPFVRSTLATYGAAYTKALDENDYFAIWGFLEASFATGNSAIVLQNLMSLFALKQGAMQHEPFLEKFLASAKIAANDFRDTEHPGYIKTDHLFGAIYLANINAEFFAPKIEQTFDTYQDGKITDFLALTTQFQTYKLKKSTLTASLGTPHDPPPTKAATHRNCITCKAQFPVSPEHPFFKYCQSCINTHRQTSSLPKPPDPPQQYQAMTQPPPDPPTDIDLWSSGEQWLY